MPMKLSGTSLQNIEFPVCYGFPVGHVKENFALKCGVEYRLKIRKGKSCTGRNLNQSYINRINIEQSISKYIFKLLNYNNLKNWHSFGPYEGDS